MVPRFTMPGWPRALRIPGRRLAEHVAGRLCGGPNGSAYNAPFERACLQHLASAVTHLAWPLTEIAGRLADLLPIVRNYVYHPDFGGSFTLKRVLPALVPELHYDGLPIADGETASLGLARLLLRGDEISPAEREAVRRALLEYCHLDTRGLVELSVAVPSRRPRVTLLRPHGPLTCSPHVRRLPGS